jgi:hypothetical protein
MIINKSARFSYSSRKKIRKIFIAQEPAGMSSNIFFFSDRSKIRRQTPWQKIQWPDRAARIRFCAAQTAARA